MKCTSCGARWTATRTAEAEAQAEPEVAAPRPPPELEPFVPSVEDDLEVVEPEPAIVAPIATTASRKEARGKVAIWAISAALIAVLVDGILLLRAEVVRLWPASGAAFAGIGLPVNTLGLVVEQVRAQPAFQGGRPVLAVTGAVRNIRDTAIDSPALRLSLLNGAGKPIAAKIVRPIDAQVPAHARRHFAIAIVDPPASVRDLEISFETGAAAASPPAATAEVGPAPVEAQPLPAGSADALNAHD